MIDIDYNITPADLRPKIKLLWQLAAPKILSIDAESDRRQETPVFTIDGKYSAQGWTEWTQGFQFGAAILQFDATGDDAFLRIGRDRTIERMASHVSHFGVHDHGFNNISTYGNLRRLMLENRIARDQRELDFYNLALKVSGAVQAARWSDTDDEDGYIYSFNGPHSLFSDTIRSLRSLAIAHQLGHCLMDENDDQVSLLDRLVQHARSTARYNVFYGQERDAYDVRGRVAHESVFNVNDGCFRCSSTQQGYSPFSTWTRGLAWIMCGYAEQLEFVQSLEDSALSHCGGRDDVVAMMLRAAKATCDFYINNTPTCGVPYWDTGAPQLDALGSYLDQPANPFNDFEPVDSSAAAIAAQGLMRLGHYLKENGLKESGETESASRYWQAGLTIMATLLDEPYLSTKPDHQGLLLHTIYHRPRGWDYVPPGSKIPFGESCMWGDYHLMEAARYVERIDANEPYLCFFE